MINKAELLYMKWKADLAEMDRSKPAVEGNFDLLFDQLHKAKVNLDNALPFLEKATKAHYPKPNVVKFTFKKVKQFITEYLEGKHSRVRKYTFSTAPATKRRFWKDVYLIIKAKRGFSLQGVKRDYKSEKITLKDAHHRIFAIMTTEKPKGKTSSWASRTSLFYRRRWLIETGFSDLNRINRRWKSNYDNLRYLDMMARMLLYNSWKMNKKQIQNKVKKCEKIKAWTLNQNQDLLTKAFLSLEKKSQGVIG